MPDLNKENLTGGNDTPTGNENPTGNETPTESDTPPQEGNENPAEDGNPTGDDTPTEDETPAEDENPAGDESPAEDGTPSEGDGNPSEDGENLTGGFIPSEIRDEETASENTMQMILSDFQESLGSKETDITTLTESIRSLVEVMSTEAQSDIYEPPDIPIEGYREWNYPVTVEYLISVVGFDEAVSQTDTYPDADIFLEDYQGFAYECFKGTTFKDFYLNKITDAGGNVVYDAQAETEEPPIEEPTEDLRPAILETLQAMDKRLETMEETLAGIDSLSANTLDYYGDTLKLYKEQNALLTNTLAVNMALLFVLVVSFGHKIAHAFWQRMRVG